MKALIKEVLSYTKNITLLYVEDNTQTRENTLYFLKEMFSTIHVGVDGEDAWDKYSEHKIDILITDIEMPKLDGMELISRIREENNDLSILITSAYDDSSYLSKAISLNVDGYIIKPLILQQFLTLILKVTKNIKMRADNLLYQNDLENQVEIEINKRKTNEAMLIQQTKMAAMGDMIDAIAHQWKQPLNAISMYMDLMSSDASESGSLGQKEVKQYQGDIDEQVSHLLNTLHEFRSFFKTDKESNTFSMKSLIESVLLLMKDELLKNQIQTEINVCRDDAMPGSENELKHLLINLINNAKDAFNERNIRKRKLIFTVSKDTMLHLSIEDNAGGIDDSIHDCIFQPRVTSKKEGQGSGIGLYMSLQIVEKHHGKLWVENTENGAKFQANFPITS